MGVRRIYLSCMGYLSLVICSSPKSMPNNNAKLMGIDVPQLRFQLHSPRDLAIVTRVGWVGIWED